MSEIIQFKNISKQFPGVLALSNVSFSIKRGEIHAVVGENGAGKSTLMNILGGLFRPTEGEVFFEGNAVVFPNELSALNLGIGVVYQELKLCPNLTIVENIFLGRELRAGRRKLDWKKMREISTEVLDSLGLDLSCDTLVKKLSIAEQQIVEIAKSISRDIKVLILDEPTSALTLNESEKLFENILALKKRGVSIIYISHRLEEILELGDRITVLRDGFYKGTYNQNEVDFDALVRLIAGDELLHELTDGSSKKKIVSGDQPSKLEVTNLSSADGKIKDINFELKTGEILAFYGVQGAGRTEMLETIFGLRKKASGEVKIDGVEVEIKKPIEAIANGIAMIPEDRRRSGLFPKMSIAENINISNPKDITKFGWLIRKRNIKRISEELRNKIGIKTNNIFENVMKLSGGNQQKVIISRWLASGPKVLLVDELTRGVDVGAKSEIFHVLRMLQEDGLGIVLVSSEIREVVAEADRVLVMRDGRIVKELVGNEISKDAILQNVLAGTSFDSAT